jgi:hypothetical protein
VGDEWNHEYTANENTRIKHAALSAIRVGILKRLKIIQNSNQNQNRTNTSANTSCPDRSRTKAKISGEIQTHRLAYHGLLRDLMLGLLSDADWIWRGGGGAVRAVDCEGVTDGFCTRAPQA